MARTPNRSEHSERDEPTSYIDERSTRGSVGSVESNKPSPGPDMQNLSFVTAERILQTPPPVRQRKRLRLAFTPTEDELLYNYVLKKHEENYCIKGMVIYQALALEHPRHTAHAWRDRAINRIVPVLLAQSPRKRDHTRKASRSKFTVEDDQFLCDWIIKKRQERESIAGNAIYRDLAEEHEQHTFHSWRDRVLRVIIPQLKRSGQWPEDNTVAVEDEMTRQRKYEEDRQKGDCNNDSDSSDDIAERVKRRRGKMKEVGNHNRGRNKVESETEEECEHETCAEERVKASTSRRVTVKINK
ncbi:375_t:CDS:1 [Paraglomus brasilianum]|uniref:DNA-binding protein RAP1 n=1 Tax=Paraglomus brasilianum TaxID=144538 RepID=A0A9N9BK07_9GLOM|nr:375_t:CDS:1 [Paraglomus brasilianum]